MSQASVVDANVHAGVLLFDGSKHGQNLVLVRQITLDGHQDATEAFSLTLRRQFLK